MISYRGALALMAALAVAVGLTAMGARGQTSSDGATDQARALPAASASSRPYVLFQAVGSGNETITAGSCADVSCQGSDTCNCVAWSVPFSTTGFSAGTFMAHLNLDTTNPSKLGPSGGICEQMAGFGKLSTSAGSTITLNIAGNACDVASIGKLQFSGAYTVTGGTGAFFDANGVGNATATMLNLLGTHRLAWTLIGTIHK
jgi:hypothetical protein